jgi:penicillin-binding protein 1C
VTMEELVKMYAMLANRGVVRPVRYVSALPAAGVAGGESIRGTKVAPNMTDSRAQEIRLLSEEASFIILDILRDNPRPDLAYSASGHIPVAWKTGTSWGFRDAWTVGVFGPYVLAAWVGNFDGQGNPAFIGVQAAAPLFFQIVDANVAMQPGIAEPSFRQPPNLRRIDVCAASGELPNAECPLRAQTWFIPGKSPIKVSTLHRSAAIDTRTGRVACPPFDPQHVRIEAYELWPSDLAHLFEQAGMPRRQPPASRCAGEANDSASGMPPAITSPLRATTYTQRAGAAPQIIALAASADADARALHWFANEAYLGAAKPGVSLSWEPSPGAYILRVVDDHGRSSARDVRVELVQ